MILKIESLQDFSQPTGAAYFAHVFDRKVQTIF